MRSCVTRFGSRVTWSSFIRWLPGSIFPIRPNVIIPDDTELRGRNNGSVIQARIRHKLRSKFDYRITRGSALPVGVSLITLLLPVKFYCKIGGLGMNDIEQGRQPALTASANAPTLFPGKVEPEKKNLIKSNGLNLLAALGTLYHRESGNCHKRVSSEPF